MSNIQTTEVQPQKEKKGKEKQSNHVKKVTFERIAIQNDYNEEIDANEVVTPTSKNKK